MFLSFCYRYLGGGSTELEFHYEDTAAHYSLWKPPGNYFPRDEAPPPYEEVVRTVQAEQNMLNSQVRDANNTNSLSSVNTVSNQSFQNPQQNPSLTTVQCRHECASTNLNDNHEYANVSVRNVEVYQNCNGSNIRQDENGTSASGSLDELKHSQNTKSSRNEKSKSYENVVVKPTCSELSKRQINKHKYENIHPKVQQRETRKTDKIKTTDHYKRANKDRNYFYENSKHRTIPNLSEYQLKDSGKVKETIKHKSRFNERSDLRNLISPKDIKDTPIHCTLPKNLRELSVVLNSNEYCTIALDTDTPISKPIVSKENSISIVKSHSSVLDDGQKEVAHKNSDVTASASSSLLCDARTDSAKNKSANKEETHSFISYQYLSSQDEDDYRCLF